jgi:hypothetical protein
MLASSLLMIVLFTASICGIGISDARGSAHYYLLLTDWQTPYQQHGHGLLASVCL